MINLFDFTEDLLESTAGFLLETGTPLTLECDILDLDFMADEVKLRQAIVNLLKNAAESSPSGS
jgi:signal transduction histidine kinase